MTDLRTKVRDIALDLEDFTLEEFLRTTTLDADTVCGELTEMVHDGYLTVTIGDQVRFRLTSDPERHLKLARLVKLTEETFYRPGETIPLGDLIKAYVQLLLTPEGARDQNWRDQEHLCRTALNEQSVVVPRLHGTGLAVITVRRDLPTD